MSGAFKNLLRSVLLVAAAFGVVWLGVVVHWRQHDHVPSTADALVWLLGAPLLLIAVFLAVRSAIEFARRLPLATVPDPAASAAVDTAPALAPPIGIAAWSLRLPTGASPAEVSQATVAGRRPTLDRTLRDHNGFPAFAARIADIDEQVATVDLELSDHQRRALLLAREVMTDAIGAALSEAAKGAGSAPALHALLLLPNEWTEAQRLTTAHELRAHIAQLGWPASAIHGSTMAVAAGIEALQQINRLGDALETAAEPVLQLVVACDSRVSDEVVAQWGRRGQLFSSVCQSGFIPGEGACAFLLVPTAVARLPGAASVPAAAALLHRTRFADGGVTIRADAAVVAQLVEQALRQSLVEAASISALVSDADHRAERIAAIAVAAQQTLPQLERPEQNLHLGVGGGMAGAVTVLSALCVAAAQTHEDGRARLVVSVADADRRGAMVVLPPATVGTQAAAGPVTA